MCERKRASCIGCWRKPHMPPRRLLVAVDEMEVGGSQRQIVQLLTHIDRARWEPEVVYFRQRSFLVDVLESAGITVHHLAKRGRVDPGFVLRFARLLDRGRYDLVHAFSLTAELWTMLAGLSISTLFKKGWSDQREI